MVTDTPAYRTKSQASASASGGGWLRRRLMRLRLSIWSRSKRRRAQGGTWKRLLPTTGTVVAMSLLLAAFSIRIVDPSWVEVLRVKTFDFYQRLAPRPVADYPVVIIDIDEKSLNAFGQWPWPRTLIAELITKLGAGGVKVVGFDSIFPEYDRLSPDRIAAEFDHLDADARAALRALPSNETAMAQAMSQTPTVVGQVGLHTKLPPGRKPTDTASPFRAEAGGDPRPFLLQYQSLLANVPELEAAAAGHGFFSIGAENDGKVRRVPLLARVGNEVRPALTLEMLRAAYGNSTLITRRDAAGMQSVQLQVRRALGGGSFTIPTDANGRIWVHFGKPDRYNTPDNEGRLYISASDVLLGRVPKDRLRDKLALIGTSAAGLKDLRDTPVANRMPGVEVHANILESIFAAEAAYALALQETIQRLSAEGLPPEQIGRRALATVDKGSYFLRYPNYANSAEIFLTLFAGLLLTFLIPRLGPLWTLAGLVIAGTIVTGLSWYLYTQHLMLFDITYPGATLAPLYAVLTFSNYTREAAEKKQVRSAFGQYLSPALVEQLADNPDQLKLGGETKEMTFLFCDVRDFTSISETFKKDPHRLTELINRLLTPMTDAILAHDGTIDKYMGDCIMAFWNAPMDVAEHEKLACQAALDMLLELDALNEERRTEAESDGVPFLPLRVGIGINTGECVVGNMGSAQRFDYSVLGDSVNLAARLEAHSKEYGVTTVLGEDTATWSKDRFALLELDRIAVKGKTEAVTIYGLLGDATVRATDAHAALTTSNTEMLAAYRAQDWDAAERLAKRCTDMTDAPEGLYALYLRRIEEFRASSPGPEWDGVYVATTK